MRPEARRTATRNLRAEKARQARWSGCTGKMPHPSRKRARLAARALLYRKGEKVYPYKCPCCANWHIGHRRKSGRRPRWTHRWPGGFEAC
jgi:cytochrome c5